MLQIVKAELVKLHFGLTDNPMYPCEEEEQTTEHLIFQCKKFRIQRNEMTKQIKKKNWWQLADDKRNTRQ